MKRIAIVGTGIAGLVAANDLIKHGFDVTIFEKNDRLGGRVQTAEIPFDGKTFYQDWGAEYYISKNGAITSLVEELELETEEYLARRTILNPSTGNYLTLPSSKDSFLGRISRMFQLFVTYKGDSMKLNSLAKKFTSDISTMYDYLDNYPIETAFELIKEEYADYLNLSLQELFLQEGMSESTIESFVSPIFRPIYMIDASEINSFLGALAFAAKGSTIYHIKGGNSRIIDALEDRISDKVNLKLHTEISSISENDDGTLKVISESSELGDFDKVFVTGPLTSLFSLDLDLDTNPELPTKIRYHQAYHTIVKVRPTAILEELYTNQSDTLFISGKDEKIWEINFISSNSTGELLCDLTTTKPLDECDTSYYFKDKPEIIMSKHWSSAYPYYSPEVIQHIPLDNQVTKNLYIGTDNIITSMDSSIRIARRFVELVCNELPKEVISVSR